MFERFKNLFSNIKISRQSNNQARYRPVNEAHSSKVYTLWLLVLPVLCGFVLGRLASSALGMGLTALTSNAGVVDAAVTGFSERAAATEKQRGLDGFLATNPFHISARKAETSATKEEQKDAEPPEPESKLEDLILRGTLPGVGAWVENKGNLSLLLVGKEIEKYKMTSVKYSEAVFRRGKTSITKYITYGPLATAAKPAEKPKATPAPTPRAQQTNAGNIVAATTDGQEGQVSSETVNQLVQNPFDELKRIRIRPNDAAGGLEVQWIQNDSILKRLGVQKGDVIRAVNGIPFTNMGDIANSINSLMNSERFDVEVTRDGKPEALRYVVR